MFSSNNSQVANDAVFVEDVFSNFLYTGNGSTQTITNGIDLSTKGGLVWTKGRSAITDNMWFDTARGVQKELSSNKTNAQATNTLGITAFGTTGYSMGSDGSLNGSGTTYASWTFRKQPKFFDVVTYTGNATARDIAHNLGSAPGCILIKRTDTTGSWLVWHRGGTQQNSYCTALNLTFGYDNQGVALWGTTLTSAPNMNSATFSLGTHSLTNASGGTYVAYLFAHNAGGFGLTGTDNVISCGSTTMGSGITTTTLGYEPQWLLIKGSNNANAWWLVDNMRGLSQSGYNRLIPNDTSAETAIASPYISITSTGFTMDGSIFGSGNTFIYIAIRRGPMKVPTDATKVLNVSGATAGTSHYVGFPPDLVWNKDQASGSYPFNWGTRLQGNDIRLQSATTNGELTGTGYWKFDDKTNYFTNTVTATGYDWSFRRAPSFFDEVCYTGNNNGVGQTLSHNLATVPELMIVKRRGGVGSWLVYSAATGATNYLLLEDTAASAAASTVWQNTAPTATQFTIGQSINQASTYVAYLFATCAGVSKCTAFTGNGTSQTINCGFTSGARFVMIKATSTTGNWTIFDSARGISAGGDPALYLNSTAAEVTGVDAIDADSTGFIVNQESTFNLNASGVQYLVLAIA